MSTAAAAPTNEDRATAFATAVRERLSDLPPDELDDLLDGLQADLAERLTDGEELGDPEAYAEELRQAAGLPPREAQESPKRRTLSELADVAEAGLRRWVEGSAVRRSALDFAVSLRPVWWVARGLALPFAILGIVTFFSGAYWWFYPSQLFLSPTYCFMTLATIVLSIQWGRGKWAPRRWLVWTRRGASVIALVALFPAVGIVWDRVTTQEYVNAGTPYPRGLSYAGIEIGNIFAYDCNGQPLDGVQLFTRDGQPLVTATEDGESPYFYDEEAGISYRYQQNPLATLPNGWSGWNVFPLQQVEDSADVSIQTEPKPAPLPFAQVPAVSNSCPAPASATMDGEKNPAGTKDQADAKAGSEADTQIGATKDQP